jgi:hypothetical protein
MTVSGIQSAASAMRLYPVNPASGTGRVESVDSISRVASVGGLKRSFDFQADAAIKLRQPLPAIQDPALGRNVDVSA